MTNQYLAEVNVLIVDDQEFVRSMVRIMLRALGCEHVYDATNGKDAWEMLQSKPIDLVILDWSMSPMTGLELTHLIRNDENSPNTYLPVIMMSGYADRQHIIEARDTGINEFVVKPLSANSLFGRVENVIEYPRAFVRTDSFFGPDRRRKDHQVDNERRGKEIAPAKATANINETMKQNENDGFPDPDSVSKKNLKVETLGQVSEVS